MKVENKGMVRVMLGKRDGTINIWQNRIQDQNTWGTIKCYLDSLNRKKVKFAKRIKYLPTFMH